MSSIGHLSSIQEERKESSYGSDFSAASVGSGSNFNNYSFHKNQESAIRKR